ncbi:MAG: hypothetical protein VB133_04765 [Anaeromusa sp.]|uniref:hypothetical protein n=1 Tax=Anaeromusa sp. TaxID=1872520 RepID=UPI002B209AD2|nr:hypothetical protein [Anaeromusa sp.]MEA4834431.1 hypothetical protein [Anaeromusa sp.]
MLLQTVIRQIQGTVLPHLPADLEVVNLLDAQTLRELLNGKVAISDQVVNKYLAIEGQGLCVYAKPDNVVEIIKETSQWGTICLLASVTTIIHDDKQSTIALQVREKKVIGKCIVSWVLSMCKMSWLTKLVGNPALGEGLAVSVDGDCITVDFKKKLSTTKLATMKLQDKSILNMVRVYSGKTMDGKIILDVCLNI